MRQALVSVTDKSGICEFAKALVQNGFRIVSTGGTAKALSEAGVVVIEVAELTGHPEVLGGRVKTLHPKVHGGILGDRQDARHLLEMAEFGIEPFELVCVNLYAFEQTVKGPHSFEEAIESIDIGGPAMIRAAAKNHNNVTIVVDPADYAEIISAVKSGEVESLRPALAAKAFRHTAYYDSVVARYLSQATGASFEDHESFGFKLSRRLRYGENPHQSGALFADPMQPGGLPHARQLWGKDPSYNNFLDADAAWELVCDLPTGSCAIVKHGNPCGVAALGDSSESFRAARNCDPVSAFGGIAAFNGPVDQKVAEALAEKGNFLEVVVSTGYTSEGLTVLKERSGWGQDVRLFACPLSPAKAYPTLRSIRGGVLVQDSDEAPEPSWTLVTERHPTENENNAMKLAWSIVPHVKSNAIVLATTDRLTGVGAGQMNRVQSVRLALDQAGEAAKDSALASDAFFPFPDSIEAAAGAGVRAVVQPGGSKKDDLVIAKANELGVAMVFTGVRHFRH